MNSLEALQALIRRHAIVGHDCKDGVFAVMTEAPSEMQHHVLEPTFVVVAQGAKRAMLGDEVFEYRGGQFLVVGVDLPIAGGVTEASPALPYLAAGMRLRPATISSLLLEMNPADMAPPTPSGFAVSDAPDELLDTVVRLLRLKDSPRDAAVLQPLVERELVWRLLHGSQGAMVRQIGLADSRLSQIGRAIRFIRAHHAEPISIPMLADMVAMSESSFHRHFRGATKMSPLQFQKLIRLQEARARILSDAGDVAAIGYSVGYDSPSQFSREYSRLFGAPPGRDKARLGVRATGT
ncbi:AraC family transcriptional regulator [Roseateles cellulosilyticus]|uniref:AraC family transcriptional regulator n=1 Tax=Pelomonas cellulosilytica TaxID=2906762 RepID=A0ABS8XX96_9BURK|nr:AraC family transcriptional regulator [Pelomonas sp. P8]MCE4555477.1 AraC family transcriptional regulator [Pelomonas sp. P8]